MPVLQVNSRSIDQKSGKICTGQADLQPISFKSDRLLAKNNSYAEANRRYLSAHGIFALNLVPSPGSGKTTLLVKTIIALNGTQPFAVTEGEDKPLKYPACSARPI